MKDIDRGIPDNEIRLFKKNTEGLALRENQIFYEEGNTKYYGRAGVYEVRDEVKKAVVDVVSRGQQLYEEAYYELVERGVIDSRMNTAAQHHQIQSRGDSNQVIISKEESKQEIIDNLGGGG